jgi:hypothetical protein
MGACIRLRRFATPWFCEEDWPRWRDIDPQIEPDYATWLAGAMAHLKSLEDQGRLPEKVIVDPEVFLAWSAGYGGSVDNKVRAAFAAFAMHAHHSRDDRAEAVWCRDQPRSGAATNEAD